MFVSYAGKMRQKQHCLLGSQKLDTEWQAFRTLVRRGESLSLNRRFPAHSHSSSLGDSRGDYQHSEELADSTRWESISSPESCTPSAAAQSVKGSA